ncbi:MAG: alpha/beta hydrolase [Actinomycetota bacterium]|nr:alpha/beta hydrolase [Actinomycetota bacterium]
MCHVEVEGVRLHYRESGSGPLALFIHGFPHDHTLWLHQLDALGGRRRCVAPDLRGFGLSDPTTATILSMERHADDLAAFIGALEVDQADVVALSMGGYVALALWERHRELVRSLALVDTRAEADDDEGKQQRDEAIERALSEGRQALADQMLGQLLADGADPTPRARLRSMVEGTRYETIVAAQRGMRDRPDRTHLLATIDVPTLLAVGEEDTVTPPEAVKAMADAVASARFVTVSGAGHLSPLEQPTIMNDILADFWD